MTLVWITTATFSLCEEIFQIEPSRHHFAARDIAQDHQSIPNIPILNMILDTQRSVPFVHYRVAGLEITKDNVKGPLQGSGGMNQDPRSSQIATCHIATLALGPYDMSFLTGKEMNQFDGIWAEEVSVEQERQRLRLS
jgi:hypothetical protein